MNYNWPLMVPSFTFKDRLKVCKFFLDPRNRWTCDKYVREYEEKVASYVGCKHAVFVTSGSSANDLVAKRLKDKLVEKGEWPKRNKVVFNVVSWITNNSVFIREGFEPIFIDANLEDFCLDYQKLEEILKAKSDEISLVFPTNVLGFTSDIVLLDNLCKKYNVELAFDNCENFFGSYFKYDQWNNLCKFHTSTTSSFTAHHLNSCEGGFIFTNDDDEFEYYVLGRAHGLLRNLIPYSRKLRTMDMYGQNSLDLRANPNVDSRFDFQVLSSNYRPLEISAFLGLLDFKRIDWSIEKRKYLYNIFYSEIDHIRYHLPQTRIGFKDVAFCLPIVCRGENSKTRFKAVQSNLILEGIEFRPFISGNSLYHKIYEKYGKPEDYPVAQKLHHESGYIGLYPNLKEKKILKLVKILNKL